MPIRRKQSRRAPRRRVPRNVVGFVKKAINRNSETKQQVLSFSGTAVGSVASGQALNYNLTQIAQGNDVHQREGNMIKITGFHARVVVTYADTTNILRFTLWQARGDNTLYTSGMDVYDLLDFDKIKVFRDKTIVVGNSGPMTKVIDIGFKFKKPLIFRYYDSGSSNWVTPPIVFSVVSDSSAASHPTMTGNYRLYYKE